MATRGGKIKKTELAAFSNVRATGIIAIDILEGDDLLRACACRTATTRSSSARMAAWPSASTNRDVRPMGRGAAGVKAISLRDGDIVVEMDVLPGRKDASADAG